MSKGLILTVIMGLGLAIPGKDVSVEKGDKEVHFAEARKVMVETQIRRRGIKNRNVLEAMTKVQRHRFVPGRYLSRAYGDYPLPIGFGQTISQPYIVALMSELMQLKGDEKVLEIGTGSGYQAAVLTELAKEVYTIEIIAELAGRAEKVLAEEGHQGVKVKVADGYFGWEEYAPFDAIIVTCAADHLPQSLVQQLKDGGRLVIPIGPPGAYQTLWQIRKKGENLDMNNIAPVSFVPLVRK